MNRITESDHVDLAKLKEEASAALNPPDAEHPTDMGLGGEPCGCYWDSGPYRMACSAHSAFEDFDPALVLRFVDVIETANAFLDAFYGTDHGLLYAPVGERLLAALDYFKRAE